MGVAGEGKPALGFVIDGPRDVTVVFLDDRAVHQEEGGARVGDGGGGEVVGVLGRGVVSDGEEFGFELPEARVGVAIGEVEISFILIGVDVSEFVCPSGVVPEVCGKEGHFQGREDTIEERLLFFGFDGVDFGGTEAEQTVGLGVLEEGTGDLGGELDGLLFDDGAADVDFIETCDSGSVGFVTIFDLEGCTGDFFKGLGFRGIVSGVTADFGF